VFEYNRRGKSKLVSGMGRRVELNELPNDRFLAWLIGKLEKYKAKKVIPDKTVLEQAYRRNIIAALCHKFMTERWKEIEKQANNIPVPKNLRHQLVEQMKSKPELPWDLALNEVFTKERSSLDIP
jgi:hypothetical protein